MATQKITSATVKWHDINDPTIHDVAELRRSFPNIHPLNLEDIVSFIERPKADFQDDYLFVVMQFPKWDAKTRLTRASEVDFIIGKGYVITVHDGDLKPILDSFNHARDSEHERGTLLGKSAGYTFYILVDRLVDYIFPILSKVEGNIRYIEEHIFDNVRSEELIREIALVRRDVLALRRIIRQQIPILEQIKYKRAMLHDHDDLEEHLDDMIDHLQKARDIIDEDAEIIAGLSDTADKLLTHRLNGVIRILTVISVIMLPLTLISSIYGMNIALPLADSAVAFEIVSATMIVIVIVMLLYFRKRRWI
jgi:magnesium transporter